MVASFGPGGLLMPTPTPSASGSMTERVGDVATL